MHYEERIPSAGLRPWVRCYWFLVGAGGAGPFDTVLPDGSMEAIFQLGDPFLERRGGGAVPQAPAILSGQIREATAIAASGRVEIAAIRFRPGRAYRFFREAMPSLVGATIPLDHLWRSASMFREALAEAPTHDARASLLDRFLLSIAGDVDPGYDAVVETIARRRGALSISALARAAGVSPRLLQRRFHDRAGIGPKSMARVLRFHSAVVALSSASNEQVRDAVAAAYYDQSHFTNEFREFSGVSPRAWLASHHRLTDLFSG